MDSLEAAMVTIVEKMATCEFYAHIYDEAVQVKLATSTTTKALDDGLDAALKDLYAAVRVFLDKAKEYFDPEKNGMLEGICRRYQILMGYVYSSEKDCEPHEAVFGHHATSNPRHFGQGNENRKVRGNGHYGKNKGFVLNYDAIEVSSGVTCDGVSGDSSRLQQVRDVVTQIREEMKPLAKLDGMSQTLLLHFSSKLLLYTPPKKREKIQ